MQTMIRTKIKQFVAPEGAEVMGIGVLGVFDNFQKDEISPILNKYGLRRSNIIAEEWYPLQLYFDLYNEMYDDGNGQQNLVAIGMSTAKAVTDPATIDGFEGFVTDEIVRTSTALFRNIPDDFGYIVNKVGDNTYHLTNNTGAPNALIYGYLWEGLRVIANGQKFTLKPVSNYPSSTDGSTFEISW